MPLVKAYTSNYNKQRYKMYGLFLNEGSFRSPGYSRSTHEFLRRAVGYSVDLVRPLSIP